MWPLLSGGGWNGFISVNGAPPGPELAFFLGVSPGWIDTMKIRLIQGTDFRPTGTSSGVALVNETFARHFFGRENPIGKLFARGDFHFKVVGLVADAAYQGIRQKIPPVAYVPFQGALGPIDSGTFIVRTASENPLTLASVLRRDISGARSEFRVSNILTQQEINDAQTVRERLLSMLALFFAGVALVLAGVGLYGVLDYTVLQRRREIGIRMALGARAAHVARSVTVEVLAMVVLGAGAGLALGLASARYISSLLYQVKASDLGILATPMLAIFSFALLAALPAVIRAVRIDPATTLRSE